jgi:Inositol monophosphatase family
LDHVTVLIGVAVGNKAVGGVIHQPYFEYKNFAKPEMSPGRTIWGITGIGTGGFEPKVAESGKTIVTTTRSHSNALVQSALDALQPDDVLRVGGAGHKVSLKNKVEVSLSFKFFRLCCYWKAKRTPTCLPVLDAKNGTHAPLRPFCKLLAAI